MIDERLREAVLAAFDKHKAEHGESCDCDLGIVLGDLSDIALAEPRPDSGIAHDLVPYPTVGKFAEVRMLYCTRCGATQTVEAGGREPLGPCALDSRPDSGIAAALLAEAMHVWRNHRFDHSEKLHPDDHPLGDDLRDEASGVAAEYARLSILARSTPETSDD